MPVGYLPGARLCAEHFTYTNDANLTTVNGLFIVLPLQMMEWRYGEVKVKVKSLAKFPELIND